MKNLFFKSLTAIFLIVALCSLTACGGGGGGSSSSNSGGNSGASILNNQTIQTTAVSNVLAKIRNSIAHLFRPSIRPNIALFPRASVYEHMTGKNIMTLAKIENITTNDGFVNSYNDSISKFKSRFSESDIIYTDNSSIIVAKNGEDNIGLIIEQNGSTKMTTYFVTNNNENEIVGVSYIKSSDYMTFCFNINKDTLEVIGKTFKYDVYDLDYNSMASTHLLSEVSGDNKNFTYGEKTGIEYKESGDN